MIKIDSDKFYHLLKLKDYYNEIKVIKGFKNYWTSIIIEDKYGLIKILPGVLITNGYNLKHAVNRNEYVLKKLKDVNFELYNKTFSINYISKNIYIIDTIYGKLKTVNPLKLSTYSINYAIDKSNFFINKAKESRVDFEYIDYTFVKYIDVRVNLQLRCKKHNYNYSQRSSHHLKGIQGCPYCMKQIIKYNDNNFDKHSDFFINRRGILYVIRLTNSNEDFFKVGITSPHRLNYRFNEFKKLYNISIEYTEEGLIVDKYKLEQRFLKEFKQYKYTPMEKFTGYTECLSINPILKYYEWYNENIKINEYKF